MTFLSQLVSLYMRAYVTLMNHISIRDLRKLSGEATGMLPGPTPVKSGDRKLGCGTAQGC